MCQSLFFDKFFYQSIFSLLRIIFVDLSLGFNHYISSYFLDERENVQKKTFTKWVNSHLAKIGAHINNLYNDLQDGRQLILLLEILSAEKLVCVVKIIDFEHSQY